ncbi:MAG: hypothetical protein N4A41_00530 [Crocinitomicaceae bacterium]|jgi:hypothetical protein|nr:hypothetical protein [Crocinitomicaceae bacterium]
MYQTFNSTIGIEPRVLIDQGILTQYNYQNLVNRGYIKSLRRACRNTPALIDFQSLPSRFKKEVIERFGDPKKTTIRTPFKDRLENDLEAVKYFNDFTLDNGFGLPEKNIAEYVANAIILNATRKLYNDIYSKTRSLGGRTSGILEEIFEEIQELPQHTYPHSLPSNFRRFKQKYREYIDKGYKSLVHKGFGNNNSEKINEEGKRWLISRWADRVNRVANTEQLFREFNRKAKEEGWKVLKESSTIYNYLHSEEIQHLWYGHRHGELKFKEKFMYQHSTKLPSMRDSLWYSDGTKLNYYYQDENGKVKTCQVYEVMDAFSEVLLGFHISDTEDYEAQYHAYKMAVKIAGHRPYQIGFDNQGGHKKLKSGNFLSKLARISIKTQPYNGKSKTIESAFNRFQSQFLKQDWFFTGQNIQAKAIESKSNMENIMANKHNLPTLEEIKAVYEKRRKEWNSATHPHTKQPRIESYLNSTNPDAPEIQLWDMVDLFWIERPKPVMMTAYGLTIKDGGIAQTYIVNGKDGMPDLDWLKKNIDRKFIVKYDPEDRSSILLYVEDKLGIRYAATAEIKVQVARNKQEQESGDVNFLQQMDQRIKQERINTVEATESILAEHGARNEDYGMTSPNIKGVTNIKRNKDSYGKVQKSISNMDNEDDDELNIYNLM